MKSILVALMTVHGLIHLMGPAKAFGLAELPELAQPITRAWGAVWLLAALGLLASAVLLLISSGSWRSAALAATVLSQCVIIAAWGDARFGTLANVLLVVFVALWSPGEPRPIVDEDGRPVPGGLSEKIRVEINGADQGMFLTSADTTHPVLLFVHGGPGLPTFFLGERYPTGLERDFTVCWWEQRGAGLSYRAGLSGDTLTAEQLVDDLVAVADYLRDRFGQERIYLMGHSWGSFIGHQAAARAPDRFHAYVGVGQVSNQLESERRAHAYMLAAFRARGDSRMVRRLEAASLDGTPPLPAAYMRLRDGAMHALGIGTTRDMRSVISGIFVPSWRSPVYTLGEKIDLWSGKWSPHSRRLWNGLLATDLTDLVQRVDIPVYFLHGRHDYTVNCGLARAYLERLGAPAKGFYTYEESAHSPAFEDPARTLRILTEDVLQGATDLADDPWREVTATDTAGWPSRHPG